MGKGTAGNVFKDRNISKVLYAQSGAQVNGYELDQIHSVIICN